MAAAKHALVLQGGAMRGIYTAGVLDVFLEKGIRFDEVVGVSAGAIHGASYMSGQAGRNIGYFTRYIRDPRFMSLRSWLTTGDLFGVAFGYHQIPEQLAPFDEAAFEANPARFTVVCTNIETGNPVYHTCPTLRGKDLEYLRASASMPLASRVVTIDGKHLLDGGISDNIPLAWAQKNGCTRAVVVLTQPAGYRKAPARTDQPFRAVYGRRYPALVRSMRDRAAAYNAQLDQVQAAAEVGDCFVIAPSQDLHLHRTERDPARLRAQYRLGRRDAMARLAALRAYLAEGAQPIGPAAE